VGLFNRDSSGYALSLDLLLAIIPLTLVLGMVAADMDNVMYQMQDVVYRGSTERVAADTMNTLLTTSGDPHNWEDDVSTLKVVGLARYDESSGTPVRYYLFPKKVALVTSSQIQSILGDQYGYSLNISSLSGTTSILKRGSRNDSSVDPAAKDVVRVERIVLYSAYDIVSEALAVRKTGTPAPVSGTNFQTNKEYLDLYDYYVYFNSTGPTTVTSADVQINDVIVIKPNEFTGDNPVIKLIDPSLLKNDTVLLDNTMTVTLRGSPTDKANVFVLQVPKGTPISEISMKGANQQKFRAILYVWVR
jgi:hypothetical protein